MLTIPGHFQAMLETRSLTIATCWRIVRQDKLILRYTTHNRDLSIGGFTYTPASGLQDSATERQDSLRESNKEIRGAIASDAITEEDLRAGKYDDARITEFVVDYRYPDAGSVILSVFIIAGIEFDDGVWRAQLVSQKFRLTKTKGRRYNRTCDVTFGDAATCKVNRTAISRSESVTAFVNRRQVDVTAATLAVDQQANNYWKRGTLFFRSGPLQGFSFKIQNSLYTASPQKLRVTTYLNLQADATSGDSVTLIPGCDHTKSGGCTRFLNRPNYHGFSYIPGSDGVFETPFNS